MYKLSQVISRVEKYTLYSFLSFDCAGAVSLAHVQYEREDEMGVADRDGGVDNST